MSRLAVFITLFFCCLAAPGVRAADSILVEGNARLEIDRRTELKELVVLDRGKVFIDDLFAADVISLGTRFGGEAIVARDSRRNLGRSAPIDGTFDWNFTVSDYLVFGGGKRFIPMRGPRRGTDAYRRNILDAITPYSKFSLAETSLSLSNTQTSQLENNLILLSNRGCHGRRKLSI